MTNQEQLTIRKRALEAIERSNTMFEIALGLLKQGNNVEAARLRSEAREQRTISTLLMAEANKLETLSHSDYRSHEYRPPHQHQSINPEYRRASLHS
jgi:hypothetical protein